MNERNRGVDRKKIHRDPSRKAHVTDRRFVRPPKPAHDEIEESFTPEVVRRICRSHNWGMRRGGYPRPKAPWFFKFVANVAETDR
jgi:hypothetical protein